MNDVKRTWLATLSDESVDLLEVMRSGFGPSYLISCQPDSRGSRYGLVLTNSLGVLNRYSTYSSSVIQELLDWCLVQLRSTLNGHIPDYLNRDECDREVGSCIDLTDMGRNVALWISAED